jgi:LacI family transcriptional regulator
MVCKRLTARGGDDAHSGSCATDGSLMARLVDIAEAAGVSVGLVSRVLNDSSTSRAAAATRERILRVADELGYRPNHAAQALKLARSNTIALVTPALVTNAMLLELMRGVEDESRVTGYTVLLGRSETMTDRTQLLHLLQTGRVDGFLLQGRDDETTESLTRLVAGAPVVLINARVDSRPGSVMIDDRAAARTATRYLLERGHRRTALVSGLTTSLTARLREEGYRQALAAVGIEPDEAMITRLGYAPESAAPALELLLRQPDPPSGVVVANVNAAMGVLTHARQMGFRVPADLSVIGIHDAWTADHTWPPLTTVSMPLYELGREAVRALQELLSTGHGADQVVDVRPPQIVERDSVRRHP